MAAATPKGGSKAKKTPATAGVTFKCRVCEAKKPISEMKIITRFRPIIVVCQDCEKGMR